ncbi:MAG: prepilin peptidase [Leptospiraceae bacterium]|nr:prepilin peptidase [Leptospiraceae bacterium]
MDLSLFLQGNTKLALYLPLFVLGASLGSFYFNLSYRILDLYYTQKRKVYTGLPRLKELLITPSHCENCGQNIPSIYLVPILGYLLTRGKCKHCDYSIPLIYPIGEIFFGLVAIFLFQASNNFLLSFTCLALTGHLIISISTDATHFSLDYENLIWILLWGSLANYLLTNQFPGLEDFYVILGFGGFYVLLYFFYPRGIGLGDVLFAPCFAFLCGHPWWMLFLNASYIPAVLISLAFRKNDQKITNTPIPMGVYFCLGLFITFACKILFTYYNFLETESIPIYE